MVASTVEIQTSCQKDAKPVYWRCDGDTDYILDQGTRTTVGTILFYPLKKKTRISLKNQK